MFKHYTRVLIAILTFVLSVSVVTGFYYRESQKVELQLPNARWEPIFFNLINQTTALGGLDELRRIRLRGDDIEVRVWRGFGLDDLEGVVLKRTDSQWKALHLKADSHAEPLHVEVKELSSPKSGWEFFWKNLFEQRLLTLRDPSETNCEDSGYDGTGYVVEINHNRTYRTYHMREEGKCPGVRQMERIDDFIGDEFDSGRDECKTAEWFACATLRKSRRH